MIVRFVEKDRSFGGEPVNNMTEMKSEYIGDGVYAIYDGNGVWLHANDKDDPTDKVYLEPKVMDNLVWFFYRGRKKAKP